MQPLTFEVFEETFAFYELENASDIPRYLLDHDLVFILTIPGDVSVMMPQAIDPPPAAIRLEVGFCCFSVCEALDFAQIGIAGAVTSILANEEISVLVMSGFAHDYFFVKEHSREQASRALRKAGYEVR